MENDPLARKRRNFYIRTEKQVKIGKIDSAEYERLYKEQNGVCAICSLPETVANRSTLSIDHSHSTGRVRGLLCNSCNTALGFFKDSEELLENALRYLRQKRGREVELLPVDAVRVRPKIIQMHGETYYSTEEACDYLGVSRQTLNSWVNKGRLRKYRQGFDRLIYYSRSELEALKSLHYED
jgi:excisionase family DNA binding protein